MGHSRTISLSLLLAACGQSGPTKPPEHTVKPGASRDVRVSFVKMAKGDSWANWPDGLSDDAAHDGRACERVSTQLREQAIARLAEAPAVAIEPRQYEQLTGKAPPAGNGTLYLLRGFSTTNSVAQVTFTGSAVTVHSDALGGLSNLRRDPCIAWLREAPSEVYSVVGYDL